MQRFTLTAVAAAAVLAGVTVREAAASSTNVSQQAITDEAKTDDATLNGKVANLLSIVVPPGFDWTNAEISIRRNPGNNGTVYNAAGGVDTVAAPVPAFWTTPGFRHGPYDTLVQSKGDSTADLVAGRAPQDGPGQPIGLGSNSVPPGTGDAPPNVIVSIAWGNTRETPPDDGPFTIGRFTLSNDFQGTFIGNIFTSEALAVPQPFGGLVVNGALVPEPTGIGLLLGASALVLRRRRRA